MKNNKAPNKIICPGINQPKTFCYAFFSNSLKITTYFFIIISFIFCTNKTKKKNVKPDKNIEKITKPNVDFITENIIRKIKTSPNVKIDSFKISKIIIKQFEISNKKNDWTYSTESYENGIIKQRGIYLNGSKFGKWYKYDENGKLISEIDYSKGKIIIGKKLNFGKLIQTIKLKSDSLLILRFGKSFFDKNIRLNVAKSYWYTSSNSGNILEQSQSKPKEFLFRYSIKENDTIFFTPIEIRFYDKSNFKIIKVKGIPNRFYNFNINYQKAKMIAKKNGFEIGKHNNEFSRKEFLELLYKPKEQSYYWTISNVSKTSYSETVNGKIRKGIGKSLYINCENGDIMIDNFKGIIIYD